MTILDYLVAANVGLALASMILLVLVTIGFMPHLRLRGQDANSYMSLFVAGAGGWMMARTVYWCLVRPVLGWIGVMDPMVTTVSGQAINAGFGLWGVLVGLAGMGALYKSLPEWAQREWGFFGAPFYPHKFTITWRW